MENLTLSQALTQYDPLIVHECEHVWKAAHDLDHIRCELPDLIQSARLRVAEKWHLFKPTHSLAPYMRRVARVAALYCLRDARRNYTPPIDLQIFAHLAG